MSPHLKLSHFALCLALVATSAGFQTPQTQAKKSALTAPTDPIAAIVNGERIMLSELLARLNELGVEPAKQSAVAGDVLDAMIDNALLLQFLAEQKTPYDAKVVESHMASVRSEIEKSGQKMSEELAKLGLTEQKLRAAAIADAQWQMYLAKNVTEKQLVDYFTKYKEFFDGSEARASHILVEVVETADDSARNTARVKAESIRKELLRGGDFAAAAKKYSDCPTKDQGGDVGWFVRSGAMVDPFASAAFTRKINEIGPLVESEFGYHILVVTGRKPGTRNNLSDQALRSQVLEAYGEMLKDEIAAKRRRIAKIEIAPGSSATPSPAVKTANQTAAEKTKK